MAYTSRFTFIGDLIIPNKSDDSFCKFWTGGKSGSAQMARMKFGIKESKTNSCFVECFGMVYESIRVGFEDGKPVEVKWADRFDEDIIASTPRYRKYIADIDGEEKQFLSQYDFIEYLSTALKDYTGKVECSGKFTKSVFEGNVYDHYEVDTVRASNATKNKLEVKMDLFYNKDCVDLFEFDDNHRITLNAYIRQYASKDDGEKFFPQKVVLDTSKAMESDDDKKIAFGKMMASKVNIKNKEVVHIPWSCKLIRGAEAVEFDESMLTNAQKEQIEFGLATIDDFNRQSFGENIYEFRLLRQELYGDFADGAIDSGYSLSDVEAELYTPPIAKETIADIDEAAASDDSSIDKALEDLLG